MNSYDKYCSGIRFCWFAFHFPEISLTKKPISTNRSKAMFSNNKDHMQIIQAVSLSKGKNWLCTGYGQLQFVCVNPSFDIMMMMITMAIMLNNNEIHK